MEDGIRPVDQGAIDIPGRDIAVLFVDSGGAAGLRNAEAQGVPGMPGVIEGDTGRYVGPGEVMMLEHRLALQERSVGGLPLQVAEHAPEHPAEGLARVVVGRAFDGFMPQLASPDPAQLCSPLIAQPMAPFGASRQPVKTDERPGCLHIIPGTQGVCPSRNCFSGRRLRANARTALL